MSDYLVPIIVLALYATLGYFRGKKKNSWIAGWISRETEDALNPADTDYVNIGGCIGYNFTYSLKGSFKAASGTITMLPRQSALYFPVSLLTTKNDRLYLNIRAEGKLAGEGHVVAQKYITSARKLISGFESFNREKYVSKEDVFYLLWNTPGMETMLREFIDKTGADKNLRHFCCHAENKNFFFHVKPRREKLGVFLKSAVLNLGIFYT